MSEGKCTFGHYDLLHWKIPLVTTYDGCTNGQVYKVIMIKYEYYCKVPRHVKCTSK